MSENWKRKLIRKTKIGTVRRIIKSRDISEHLNLEKGFVTNIDQLEDVNGELFSRGNDPKIFIRFNKPIKELYIELEVKTHFEDKIELFYSDVTKSEVNFSYNDCYKIGKTNKKFRKNIVFLNPTRYFRLDLGEHEGKIEIISSKIKPGRSSLAKDYSEYSEILDNIAKSDRQKMVIVTHALNETGAPLLALNIAKSFQERNYDVVVISLSDGYLEEEYDKFNIPLICLQQSPMSKEIHNPKALEEIIKILSSKGYNKVITNTIISGITAPIFKKYNFSIISLIHEMYMSISLYDMKQGGRDISMYSDKIVFPDKIVHEEFMKHFSEDDKKSIIRPQGLYATKEKINKNYAKVYKKYDIPENSKIIMGSGTADFRKGIDLFLIAAQKLIQLEEEEEYHFIWTGKILNEEVREWYDLQFAKYGLADRFHNVDFIKNKAEYQNLVVCSDAFWLTSREDPFPSVMIESLEYSTPVLGFAKSGGASTLLDEGRGVLIDNFDAGELALKTHEILKDPKLCESMIKKAQEYIAEKLQFEDYIIDLEKMFKDLEKTNKVVYGDVSVIVPNYNYEEYLPIRLRSIINQTIKPKEIILLDDVSNDQSIEVSEPILKEAKAKYKIDYKIIKNETNNGCFKQWLKGIDFASYPYIWIAEADDYAQKNFLETLLPAFDDKDVVLSYVQSKVIDETSKVVDYAYTDYTNDLSKEKWLADFKESGIDQVKKYFSKKNIIPNASSTIIRKSATKGLDNILRDYQVIGDWVAYIYILSKGKVSYSRKALNGHRRHSESIIARQEKSLKFIEEIIRIKKYVVENFNLNDLELNHMLTSIEGIDKDYEKIQNDDELKELWNEFQKQVNMKRKKKNILIIIPDLSVGGGQTVAIRLANSIRKYYNVFLINARNGIETDFMKEMINSEVTVLDYDNSVEAIRLFKELLQFHAVISLIWWADKLAYYSFGHTDIPWIISMHGCYEMLLHNPEVDSYFNENVKDMLDRADKIVYTADKNKEILEKYNLLADPKVSKVDNGFLLENYPKKRREELQIKDDDFVFGLVARAIPEKGYEEAIKAIYQLNAKASKKAHLILVGASEYIDRLKEENKTCEYIHFIDEFNEPMEWIGWEELFDVGLLPSYFKSESLPTVIVEYLYLNKPVIATDIAEIKSMIESKNKKAGVAIPLKNGKADIDILVKEMNKMMNDKKYYEELKNNTKDFAKRFDMDLCIKSYRDLIEECNDEKE